MRVLVKEVEEARGGVVSTDYLDPPILSSNAVSSSSQVISEHLVSFRYVIVTVFETNLYNILIIILMIYTRGGQSMARYPHAALWLVLCGSYAQIECVFLTCVCFT